MFLRYSANQSEEESELSQLIVRAVQCSAGTSTHYPVVHTHLLLDIQYTIPAASRLKRGRNISRSSKQPVVHSLFRQYLKLKLLRHTVIQRFLFGTLCMNKWLFFLFPSKRSTRVQWHATLGKTQEQQQYLDEAIPTETSNLTAVNQVYYYCCCC